MWIILGVISFFGACYFMINRQRNALKRHGIRVTGTVIELTETASARNDGPGGIIYSPVVRFTTIEGVEITGRPVTGFVSQVEINTSFNVTVYYNPKKPLHFHIEF